MLVDTLPDLEAVAEEYDRTVREDIELFPNASSILLHGRDR